jgi:antitoxin component of MazEF toxin-antitoxin module
MAMRVQRMGNEYCVVLTAEQIAALHLSDGAEVEVRPANTQTEESRSVQYLSIDETLDSYRETLPQHRDAYIELAK